MSDGNRKTDSGAVICSVRIYRCLLLGYPREYRQEYGSSMAQLFGDQCRDAWRGGGRWGLMRLWLRVLLDLMVTSVQEHISTLKGSKNMMQRMGAILAVPSSPRRVFFTVFLLVFLLVTATSTLITFIMPESYCSTARVLIDFGSGTASEGLSTGPVELVYDPYFIQTQFEIVRSDLILGKVVDHLDLGRVWGKRYAGGNQLSQPEAVCLLRARLDLRPVRSSRLVEIRVFSDKPAEAATLANAIARTYQQHNGEKKRTDIVDVAVPGLIPVRPNKPLNIALGAVGGALLALIVGGGIAWTVSRFGRRWGGKDEPPPAGETPGSPIVPGLGSGARS